MPNHHISIAYAAFIAAQSAPEEVNISSFTRGIYALLSPLPTFWRVVGITENALKKLSENLDANRLPTGLRRAHIQQRAETVTTLLTGPEISIEDFEKELSNNRKIDALVGGCNIGPHKSDYIFYVNNNFFVSQLSTGQQKTIILLIYLSMVIY